ncbi:hypothetical protein H0A65_11090 [Alcaligenaceae bacterium]|nr:hypothetical protein [Alcaligenaceae bacterium]
MNLSPSSVENPMHNSVVCQETVTKTEAINAVSISKPNDDDVVYAHVIAWIHEDELPDNYPYEAMFLHSKVDLVRLFPVFAPIPDQPDGYVRGYEKGWNSCITAMLKDLLPRPDPVYETLQVAEAFNSDLPVTEAEDEAWREMEKRQ